MQDRPQLQMQVAIDRNLLDVMGAMEDAEALKLLHHLGGLER